MAFDVGKKVAELQDELLGPDKSKDPTRAQLLALLDALEKVLTEALIKLKNVHGNPGSWPQGWSTENYQESLSELQFAGDTYKHYRKVLADEQIGPTELWAQVTGPLVGGMCYGPPTCSETLTVNGPVPIAPAMGWPFVAMNAIDEQARWSQDAWERFREDVAENAKVAVSIGVGALGLAAAAVGIYLLWKMGGRRA